MNKRPFDWVVGGFLIGYQVLLLIALPFYFIYAQPSWALFGIAGVLLYAAGLAVTAGYHRYFSHRAYKAHPIVESVLLFFGAMALQSSALRWSHDHRLHHAHVDTDEDPYSIKKGFWYAHFMWMLYKADPMDPKLVSDLARNPRVRFQHRFIVPLMFGTNILVGLFVGWLLNDYLGAFVIAVALRVFVLHHFTWFINSLAHTWGDRPFCQEQTAVNNFALSMLTFGEGYHNYHHVFAKDYRNGVRWFHFDPTKWLIWGLSKMGLAKGLYRVDERTIAKRMILERKSLLLEKIATLSSELQSRFTQEVEQLSERLLDQLKRSVSLKEDWQRWQALSRSILRVQVLHKV